MLFEKNLVVDPVTSKEHGLYNAIMRVQALHLQDRLACVIEERPMDPKSRAAMADWLETIKVGGMTEFSLGLAQKTHPLHVPFRQGFEEASFQEVFGIPAILKENAQSIARSGGLAKSILAAPIANILKGALGWTPDVSFDLTSLLENLTNAQTSGGEYELMQVFEYKYTLHLNSSSDRAATTATLNTMLETETNFSNTGWRKLAQIHHMLYAVAVKYADWAQAIHHLDERSQLFRSGDLPWANCHDIEEILELLCQYIFCYARHDKLEMVATCYWKAIFVITKAEDRVERWRELANFMVREASAVNDYMFNKTEDESSLEGCKALMRAYTTEIQVTQTEAIPRTADSKGTVSSQDTAE